MKSVKVSIFRVSSSFEKKTFFLVIDIYKVLAIDIY